MLVVDASVAIKWVVPEGGDAEKGTDEALTLLDGALIAPDLLLIEFGNVLWKKVRRGEIEAPQARDALQILPAIVSMVPVADHMDSALQLAILLDHPLYDCLYLATAKAHDCGFATADLRLAAKCRDAGLGIPVIAMTA